MKVTLSMKTHVSVARELDALRAMCERTGDDLRALIVISPGARQRMDDFVAYGRAHKLEVTWVLTAIRRREAMLDILDREETDARDPDA